MRIDVNVRVQNNSRSVVRMLARADERFLHWYGGALRKSIRRNVRKRKNSSKPGKSPSHWVGDNDGLRRVQYDVKRDVSVTVGPIKYNGKQTTGTPTPKLMESGGNAKRQYVFQVVSVGKGSKRFHETKPRGIPKRNLRIVYSKQATPKQVRYHPRPFVKPAFDRLNRGIEERYAKAVRRAGA